MASHKRELSSGLWRLVVERPRDPDRPGERQRLVRRFRGTARQAETEVRRLEALVRAGALTTPARLTVKELFSRFLAEHVRIRLAPGTYVSYESQLRLNAAPLHALLLSQLAPHHLSRLEAQLQSGPPPRAPRASNSVKATLVAVGAALQWAERQGLLERNPLRRYDPPAAMTPERPALSLAQARRYLAALGGLQGGHRQYALPLTLLLATPLRVSEVRGLRWADISLTSGAYRVVQQWQCLYDAAAHCSRDVLRPVPKSQAGKRGGALPAAVVAALTDHRDAQRFAQRAAGRRWQALDLVFTTPEGEPFRLRPLNRAHRAALLAAGLLSEVRGLRPHDLRGTWITLQLAAGTPEYEVIRLAGHASPAVSRAVYQHLDEQAGGRAAERLWELLRGE